MFGIFRFVYSRDGGSFDLDFDLAELLVNEKLQFNDLLSMQGSRFYKNVCGMNEIAERNFIKTYILHQKRLSEFHNREYIKDELNVIFA